MNAELDLIESKLTESTNIELSAIGLETLAKVNVASGLLSEITFDELKEPFELEPEFDEEPTSRPFSCSKGCKMSRKSTNSWKVHWIHLPPYQKTTLTLPSLTN